MNELEIITGSLNLLQPPSRLELLAKEILSKAKNACENLSMENSKLKEELETERKQHSETRDKLDRATKETDQQSETLAANEADNGKLRSENRKLKNQLATAITDPQEIIFYHGARATLSLRKFFRSKDFKDRPYTVAELVSLGVSENLLSLADSDDPEIGLLDFKLVKQSDGNFKIIYR